MNRNIYRLAGVVLVATVMAGCGGGGDGNSGSFFPFPVATTTPPPATTTPPPVTQLDAYDQFLAYVQTLVASVLDMAEPANVAAYDPPPTSETKEPVATQ